MFAQIKLYLYLAIFAGLTSVAGYGYYLYNQVESLEKEKEVMQATIDVKDAQMKEAIESINKANQELEVVRAQSNVISQLADQKQKDLETLRAKNSNLWSKIQTSQKPEEFNGQVNSEFTSVLSCIEKATGNINSKCEVTQ